MSVRIQTEPFDIGHEVAALKAGNSEIGAIVTFTGTVRATSNGRALTSMTLEHYPGMTQTQLQAIESQAHKRWPLDASLIVHRVGTLKPGQDIVLVIAASKHRAAAFEAASFLMDFLKTSAPFWKKEEADGHEAEWVDTRESDTTAQNRWKPT